jgi:hypothetical protein
VGKVAVSIRANGLSATRSIHCRTLPESLPSPPGYNGMIHDFGLLNLLSSVAATRTPIHQAAEELRAALMNSLA